MSVEEDTELRDLVSKTLENNGVLAKIRAELRASVFLALEEQATSKAPFENKTLKEYLKSPQGALGLCIVREFLEYLELDFTLSVYNTETSHGKGYEYSGRDKIIKDLQIKSLYGRKGPLLSLILQIALGNSGDPSISKEGFEANSSENVSFDESPRQELNGQDEAIQDSPNASVAPLDRTFTSDGSNVRGMFLVTSGSDQENNPTRLLSVNHPSSLSAQSNDEDKENSQSLGNLSETDGNCLDISSSKLQKKVGNLLPNSSGLTKVPSSDSESNFPGNEVKDPGVAKTGGKNPMASLDDLPPLNSLQGKRNLNSISNINFSQLGLQDDYDEDFVSTDGSSTAADGIGKKETTCQSSGKQELPEKENIADRKLPKSTVNKGASERTPNSPVGSISEELDDDTTSGLDDLLNSTASTDHTVDHTLSHIRSSFADYIEEI